MNKFCLALLFSFALVGCQSGGNTNDYTSMMPKIAPELLSGLWTLNGSDTTWTLKVNNNGTGKSCYVSSGQTLLQDFKFDGTNFILQDQSTLYIEGNQEKTLTVSSDRQKMAQVIFFKDDGKILMSESCLRLFELQRPL